MVRIKSHPGEILKEEYMVPHGISAVKLAEKLGSNEAAVSRLVNGKSSMTPLMALRLSILFNTTTMFWMNLQMYYDISVIESNEVLMTELNNLKPYFKHDTSDPRDD